MKKHKLLSLLVFFILCVIVASLGSFATKESLTPWYSHLDKPAWNPPSWVFPPVWTILYIMIAFAGWLLFIAKPSHERNWALFFYFMQLLLNGLWSFLFFYFHNPTLGLIDIFLLNIFIALTMFESFRTSRKLAGILLLPYFLWTLYALTLNAGIAYLN